VGGGGMEGELLGLIKVLAPTVAEKVFSLLQGRKADHNDALLLVTCLLAEQNSKVAKGVEEMSSRLASLGERMEAVAREVRQVNEGVAVLLRRTER